MTVDHVEFRLEDIRDDYPNKAELAAWIEHMEAQGARVHLFIANDLKVYLNITIMPGEDPAAQQRLRDLYDKTSARIAQLMQLDQAHNEGALQ